MPPWLRALLMGSTALCAPEDDRGVEFEEEDPPADEAEDDEDAPPEEDDLDGVDPDAGDEEDGEPPARQTRGNRQFGELRRTNRDLARQLEEERQARIAAEARAQERQRQESQAAERQRLEAMEPWERQQYEAEQRERRRDNEIAQLRFQNFDNGDRADFRAACAEIPAYSKIRDQVEAEYQRIVKSGANPTPRETIAKYLIGDAAVKKLRSGSGKRVERAAAESRQRQQARPGSARSDARVDVRGLNEKQARAKRVENMKL